MCLTKQHIQARIWAPSYKMHIKIQQQAGKKIVKSREKGPVMSIGKRLWEERLKKEQNHQSQKVKIAMETEW